MALNKDVLAAALKPLLKQAHLTVGAHDNAALDRFMTDMSDAIATAVIAHIKASGVVTVTGTATGALGGGPGVPVVGTGTIG